MARAGLLALAAVAFSLFGAQPASAAPAWSTPFRVAGPMSLDVLPAEVGFSARGQAAVAFAVQNEDAPSDSQAYFVLRSPAGTFGSMTTIPGAQEVLDFAFQRQGQTLQLLTGTSATGDSCCGSVQLVPVRAGTVGQPRTLLSGLTGATLGRVIAASGGRLLAAVATARGVWAGASLSANAMPSMHHLTRPAASAQSLAAVPVPGFGGVVAFTAPPLGASARSVFVAVGPKLARAASALRLASGHEVDQLAIAPARGTVTLGWIESWLDRRGKFHSDPVVADLGASIRPVAFPLAGKQASDISLAGDPQGDQVLAWKACDSRGVCSVRAAARRAGARFAPVVRLGATDASQAPAAAVSPHGELLVAWIDAGHVLAADRAPRAQTFAVPAVVSATRFAADLALAFGPRGQALAVWTQGTFAQSVMGAAWR